MKSDLVDIEVALHHETEKAYLVSTDGERASAVWIPKSMCDLIRTERDKGENWTITLTERLATEKGLT